MCEIKACNRHTHTRTRAWTWMGDDDVCIIYNLFSTSIRYTNTNTLAPQTYRNSFWFFYCIPSNVHKNCWKAFFAVLCCVLLNVFWVFAIYFIIVVVLVCITEPVGINKRLRRVTCYPFLIRICMFLFNLARVMCATHMRQWTDISRKHRFPMTPFGNRSFFANNNNKL